MRNTTVVCGNIAIEGYNYICQSSDHLHVRDGPFGQIGAHHHYADKVLLHCKSPKWPLVSNGQSSNLLINLIIITIENCYFKCKLTVDLMCRPGCTFETR